MDRVNAVSAPPCARVRIFVCCAFFLSLSISTPPGHAQSRTVDWQSCASALDDLQSNADDAKSDAEEAADTQDKFERCRKFPEIDTYGDRCQTRLQKYRRAFEDASSSAQNALNAADSVQASCSPMTAQERLSVSQARLCEMYKRYSITQRPLAMESCLKSQGPDFCAACLGQ